MSEMALTVERLREVLSYEEASGKFFWKVRAAQRRNPGEEAGSPSKNGRMRIRIDGKLFYRYRIAWLYITGSWPSMHIDHINGNPTDDRWSNLRDISQSGNLQNQRRANVRNKTGLLGVWKNKEGRYESSIVSEGKKRYLGSFATPEEAHQAYINVKRQIHEGCTI